MKIAFRETVIMGILNVTPDSFSDGGNFTTVEKAVKHAKKMIQEGASIIDIGGESTRPGAKKVSIDVELARVIPTIRSIKKLFPKMEISIDTYKQEVAEEAIINGATIINDVSGLQLSNNMMAETASKLQVPIIINHMKGIPQTMQKEKIVYKNIMEEINNFFSEKIDLLERVGVKKHNIILDPGFGFGKTVEHNITILNNLHRCKKFNLPILIGVSRKSTLGIVLQNAFNREFIPKERLYASLAATAIAVLNGASIVRTHDVLATKQFLAVLDTIRTQNYERNDHYC